MEKLVENKNQMKKDTYFDKWLKKEVGDKMYFEELTEEEVYKIILKISEITFSRYPILNLDHSFEDAASVIYRNFLLRDVEKEFNEIETSEFRYKDEKTGKFYKWVPRQICKGFKKMIEDKLTVEHFKNLIFREMRNHYQWNIRNKKVNMRMNNTISLNYENENMKMIEKIEDEAQSFDEVENNLEVSFISEYIDNEEVSDGYFIKVDNKRLDLTFSNLLKLYYYLSGNRRVSSSEILEHIIYKDNEQLSKENISYIGRFITSLKKYLLEIGVINESKFMQDGKEKKRYGFAKQLS